jgi:hypothetical protein
MVSVYGVQDKSEAEWGAFWGIYVEALSGFPATAIREGVKAYIALPDSEFFPKPGKLRSLCAKWSEVADERASRPPTERYDIWTWPSDDELQSLSLQARRREYLIMASECRNRAGAMTDEGVHPHPEWIVKARNFEEEAKNCSGRIAKGAQREDA